MDRRRLIAFLAMSFMGVPFVANAQPPIRTYRLGILRPSAPFLPERTDLVTEALREFGYVEDATTTVPIVMFDNGDPISRGFVSNLARPGGNITGVLIAPDGTLAGKKLELLKEAVPHATRIAMLIPTDPSVGPQVAEVRQAATWLGIDLRVVEVQGSDYDRAFAIITAERPGALFVA